jgi:adenine-specific DNA-methyltransferase
LGILNSKLTKFILKQICDKVQGGFYRLKMIYIERVPIKRPESIREKELQKLIENLVAQIIEVKQQLRHVKTDRDRGYLETKCNKLDSEIDIAVYQVYGLTAPEIAIIEKK